MFLDSVEYLTYIEKMSADNLNKTGKRGKAGNQESAGKEKHCICESRLAYYFKLVKFKTVYSTPAGTIPR
jgi:hypothetical protein